MFHLLNTLTHIDNFRKAPDGGHRWRTTGPVIAKDTEESPMTSQAMTRNDEDELEGPAAETCITCLGRALANREAAVDRPVFRISTALLPTLHAALLRLVGASEAPHSLVMNESQ